MDMRKNIKGVLMIKEKIAEWNQKMTEIKKENHFQIHINFQTPRAGNDIMMFDSVLSYFAMKYLLGVDFHNLGKEWIHVEIPVKKWDGSDPFYFITGIMDQPDIPTYWIKRYEKRYLQSVGDKLVRTNMGKFRNYMQPLLTSTKEHYVIDGIGNYELIKEILPEKTFLGKKTGSGYGQCIVEVKLIKSKAYPSDLISCPGYALKRHLPCSYFTGPIAKPIIGMRPVKYPYYGKMSQKCKVYEAGSIL
jgi:hypothetical protein